MISHSLSLGVCVLLAVAVWHIYGQVLQHEFINFDDDAYVSDNRQIQDGVTPANIVWAFTHPHTPNWHPLATISHMLDCQWYRGNAGGHHLTNVLLHVMTSILLFLVLRQMTGRLWASAFVAAVFAVHPLRVESVAWIAERKDVLSGLFFVLTLGAYTRYARQPSWKTYSLVLLAFALGLLSKSMLVTVPFVLLLLDIWPLGRWSLAGPSPVPVRGLLLEKIPLLAMSIAICIVMLEVQRDVVQYSSHVTVLQRLANAVVAYAVYLGQLFYPARLAVFYPLPVAGVPIWKILSSLIVLAAGSAAVLHWRSTRPWLLVGWLWFLGMLVPVIGLVQVGGQAHADRYTYLPEIGLLIMLTWTVRELTERWHNRPWWLGIPAVIVLVALTLLARIQTAYWHDSGTLWVHTLACTSDANPMAQGNLATFRLQQGDIDEAAARSRKSLAIWPNYDVAHNCLGIALAKQGHAAEAVEHFRKVVELRPGFAPAERNLGKGLLQNVQIGEGIAHLQRAIELDPRFATAMNELAWALATQIHTSFRNGPRALELAQEANRLTRGGDLLTLRTVAAAQAECGQFTDAIATATQAAQWAQAQSSPEFVAAFKADILLYQANQPIRELSQ